MLAEAIEKENRQAKQDMRRIRHATHDVIAWRRWRPLAIAGGDGGRPRAGPVVIRVGTKKSRKVAPLSHKGIIRYVIPLIWNGS